jgi:hypothetical protein
MTSCGLQSITRIDIDWNVLFVVELVHYFFKKCWGNSDNKGDNGF